MLSQKLKNRKKKGGGKEHGRENIIKFLELHQYTILNL